MQQILGLFILASMIVGAILTGRNETRQFGKAGFVDYAVGAAMGFVFACMSAIIFSIVIALLMGAL